MKVNTKFSSNAIKELREQIKAVTETKKSTICKLRQTRDDDLCNQNRVITKKSIRATYSLNYRQIMNEYKSKITMLKTQIKELRDQLKPNAQAIKSVVEPRFMWPTESAQVQFQRIQYDQLTNCVSDSDKMFTVFSSCTDARGAELEQKIQKIIEQIPIKVQHFNLSIDMKLQRWVRFLVVYDKQDQKQLLNLPLFAFGYSNHNLGFNILDHQPTADLPNNTPLQVVLKSAFNF